MPEYLALVNPRKRRRKRRTSAKRRRNPISAVAANPRRRRRRRNPISLAANPRRRRRNPRVNVVRMVQDALIPSVVSAGAVIGVDVGLSFLPLPPTLKTGPVRNITRAVGVVALGMLAGQFARPDTVRAITSGGLAIIMHDTLKGFAAQMFPQLALGEMDLDGLGWTGYGWNPDLTDPGMGAYLTGPSADPGMGAYMAPPAGVGMGQDDLDY